MSEFWQILSKLIQQYTIADTASVFSIIGGIATVIAAVGAIIAVVLTKKIATEQIEIAKKQNRISDKQADIATQQNKIALFEYRSKAYDELTYFFNIWNSFRKGSLDSLKVIPTINSFQTYISFRELGKLDLDYIKSKDWFYFLSKQSDFFLRDINNISQVLRLFKMPNEQKAFMTSIVAKYKRLSDAVHAMKYPDYSVTEFERLAIELSDDVNSKSCKDLLFVLNEQISFGNK